MGALQEDNLETRSSVKGRVKGVRLLSALPADAADAGSRIALISADRDFADAVPAQDRTLAEATLRMARVSLKPGEWAGPDSVPTSAPSGYLVTSGLVSRNVTIRGRTSIELFGPGDFIGAGDLTYAPAAAGDSWEVHQPCELATLDERFAVAAARWPGLWHVIVRRTSLRGQRLATQLAALQLSRVEDRVEEVLWQLADRWGRVTQDGVVVPIALTHQLLGRLVAAKRPTVSIALATLTEAGAVRRRDDGSWLLLQRTAA